jgi:hypothetical protein
MISATTRWLALHPQTSLSFDTTVPGYDRRWIAHAQHELRDFEAIEETDGGESWTAVSPVTRHLSVHRIDDVATVYRRTPH